MGPELEPKLEPALRRTERSAAAKPSKGLGARGGPRRGSRRLRHAAGTRWAAGDAVPSGTSALAELSGFPGLLRFLLPHPPERVTGTRAPPGKCKEPEVYCLPEYQASILRAEAQDRVPRSRALGLEGRGPAHPVKDTLGCTLSGVGEEKD